MHHPKCGSLKKKGKTLLFSVHKINFTANKNTKVITKKVQEVSPKHAYNYQEERQQNHQCKQARSEPEKTNKKKEIEGIKVPKLTICIRETDWSFVSLAHLQIILLLNNCCNGQ